MLASRPDLQQGMAEVYKEMAKLDGMPVFQTTVMGGDGTAPVDRSDAPQGTQQQKDKPSMGSVVGGALGGRFGLGRKKQPEEQPQQQQSQGTANGAGVLIEMTTESGGFSAASVDASQFEIPAGFKKVEPDLKNGKQ